MVFLSGDVYNWFIINWMQSLSLSDLISRDPGRFLPLLNILWFLGFRFLLDCLYLSCFPCTGKLVRLMDELGIWRSDRNTKTVMLSLVSFVSQFGLERWGWRGSKWNKLLRTFIFYIKAFLLENSSSLKDTLLNKCGDLVSDFFSIGLSS